MGVFSTTTAEKKKKQQKQGGKGGARGFMQRAGDVARNAVSSFMNAFNSFKSFLGFGKKKKNTLSGSETAGAKDMIELEDLSDSSAAPEADTAAAAPAAVAAESVSLKGTLSPEATSAGSAGAAPAAEAAAAAAPAAETVAEAAPAAADKDAPAPADTVEPAPPKTAEPAASAVEKTEKKEAAEKSGESSEGGSKEAEPKGKAGGKPAEEKKPDTVSFGDFKVNLAKDGDTLKVSGGKMMVFGKEVEWQTVGEVTYSEESSTATGKLKFDTEKLSVDELSFSASGDGVTFTPSSSSNFVYKSDDLELALNVGGEMTEIKEISASTIEVSNRTIDGLDKTTFEGGDSKFGEKPELGEGLKKPLEKRPAKTLPEYILHDGPRSLALVYEEDKLKYGIHLANANFKVKGNHWWFFSEYDKDLFAEANSSGHVIYRFNESKFKFALLFKKLAAPVVPSQDFAVESGGEGLSRITFGNFETSLGSLGKLSKADISIDLDKKEAAVDTADVELGDEEMKESPYHVNITGIALGVGKKGLHLDSASAEAAFKFGDKEAKAKGNIKNFNVIGEKAMTFDELSGNVSNLAVMKDVEILNGKFNGKKSEKIIDLGVEGDVKFALDTGWLQMSSEKLHAMLKYAEGNTDAKPETGKAKVNGFTGELKGSAAAKLLFGGAEAASADATDLALTNEGFASKELKLALDTSKALKMLDLKGNVDINEFAYDFDKNTVSYQSFTALIDSLGIGGKTLLKKQVSASLSKEDLEGKQEMSIGLPGEKVSLELGSCALSAEGPSVTLNVGKGDDDLAIGAEKISASIGSFAVEGALKEYKYADKTAEFEELSAKLTSLPDPLKNVFGESPELTVKSLKYKDGKFTYESAEGKIKKSIALFGGLSIEELTMALKDGELGELSDISVSGKVAITRDIGSLSGRLGLTFQKDKGFAPKLDNVGELELAIGKYGKGSVKEIVGADKGFDLNEVELKNDTPAEDDKESSLSFTDKLLKEVPGFTVAISKIQYRNDQFIKPNKKDVKIKEVKTKEYSFLDGKLKGSLGYKDGVVTGELKTSYMTPDSREKSPHDMNELIGLEVGYPIFPFLSATLRGSLMAGLDAEAGLKLEGKNTEGSENGKTLGITTQATANADAGPRVSVGLKLGYGKLSASANVFAEAVAQMTGNLTGKTALKYDPGKDKSLLQSLSISKEDTGLNFKISGDIVLNIGLNAGVEIPPVLMVDSKKLKFDYTLFTYKFGTVVLEGGVNYEPNSGGFVFDKDARWESNIANARLESSEKALTKIGGNAERLGETLTAIKQELEEVFGSSPTGEIAGLGVIYEEIRFGPVLDMQKKLKDVIKNSMKNLPKANSELLKLKKYILNYSGDYMEAQAKTSYAEQLTKDSAEALDLIATRTDDDGKKETFYTDHAKVFESFKNTLSDDAALDKLAALDPISVLNMVKIYKLHDMDDFSKIDVKDLGLPEGLGNVHEFANRHSLKMYENQEFAADLMGVKELGGKKQVLKEFAEKNKELITDGSEEVMTEKIKKLQKIDKKNTDYAALIAQKQKGDQAELEKLEMEIIKVQGSQSDEEAALAELEKEAKQLTGSSHKHHHKHKSSSSSSSSGSKQSDSEKKKADEKAKKEEEKAKKLKANTQNIETKKKAIASLKKQLASLEESRTGKEKKIEAARKEYRVKLAKHMENDRDTPKHMSSSTAQLLITTNMKAIELKTEQRRKDKEEYIERMKSRGVMKKKEETDKGPNSEFALRRKFVKGLFGYMVSALEKRQKEGVTTGFFKKTKKDYEFTDADKKRAAYGSAMVRGVTKDSKGNEQETDKRIFDSTLRGKLNVNAADKKKVETIDRLSELYDKCSEHIKNFAKYAGEGSELMQKLITDDCQDMTSKQEADEKNKEIYELVEMTAPENIEKQTVSDDMVNMLTEEVEKVGA